MQDLKGPAGDRDRAFPQELVCRRDSRLTAEDKRVFAAELARRGLDAHVWDLFEEWVARSTEEVRFFYLKVFANEALVGLGLFVQIKPFDLRRSYARLRKAGLLNKLGGLISRLSKNSLIVSFRNLITSNHTRCFFFREPELEEAAMGAMLSHLKAERSADMVTIVDTASHQAHYRAAGFEAYPSSSEAWFDVSRYGHIDEYLAGHPSLRKNLKRRRSRIAVEARRGRLSEEELAGVTACVRCSVQHSLVANPCQRFFEEQIFSTAVFRSEQILHLLVRVDGAIAGFHSFQESGTSLGGVLGGFDRARSRNNFVYERVIVSSLEQAIHRRMRRVQYSLVDNQTKLRLVDLREPCGLYFFARSPVNRAVFRRTFKHNDVHRLWRLEFDRP